MPIHPPSVSSLDPATRLCACGCGTRFVPQHRSDQVYCSKAHKVAASKARNLRKIVLLRLQHLRGQADLGLLLEDPLLSLLALRQAADGAVRLALPALLPGVHLSPMPDPADSIEVLQYCGGALLYLHIEIAPGALSQMEAHEQLYDPRYERIGVGVVHPGGDRAAVVVVLCPAAPAPDLDSAPKLSG